MKTSGAGSRIEKMKFFLKGHAAKPSINNDDDSSCKKVLHTASFEYEKGEDYNFERKLKKKKKRKKKSPAEVYQTPKVEENYITNDFFEEEKLAEASPKKSKLQLDEQLQIPLGEKDGCHVAIIFSEGATNYREALLEILEICPNVFLSNPGELKISLSSHQYAEKISILSKMTVEREDLLIQKKTEFNTLRRLLRIEIDEQFLNIDEIVRKLGAVSARFGWVKQSKVYILIFKSIEAAMQADSRSVYINGKNYGVGRHLHIQSLKELISASDDSSPVQQNELHDFYVRFPLGSSDHKSALLHIVLISEVVDRPPTLLVNCNDYSEAQEIHNNLQLIDIETMKCHIIGKMSDPWRES